MKLVGDHNQCAGCNEYFNSGAAFDKHRVGDYGRLTINTRRCLKPTEMIAAGMAKNSTGWWVTKLRTDNV